MIIFESVFKQYFNLFSQWDKFLQKSHIRGRGSHPIVLSAQVSLTPNRAQGTI